MRKSRILFFADRLLDLTLTECYNGGGWITSFLALTPRLDAEVGMAGFFPVDGVERHPIDKATMYKMPIQHESAWAKVKKYYLNQQTDTRQMEASVREVLSDFKPDLIYLFGLDYLSSEVVLNLAEVPVLVHLQGVLGPIVDAYFPPGISKKEVLRHFSVREHLLRNGYIRGYYDLRRFSLRDADLIRKAACMLGRTTFDREYVEKLCPEAKYRTLQEILREPFYANAGKAVYRTSPRLKIVSTLSDTFFKGFDMVLKTAALLKERGIDDWEWQVMGLDADARLVKLFEKILGISSPAVNVRFMGVCNADKVCEILLGADVYAHPSYVDNSPNSVCEAQMLGVPVVASEVGGIGSLVTSGETGLLVPAGDPAALADALQSLSADPSLRLRLGEAGCACALRRHDKETAIRKLEFVIQEFLPR